MRVGFEVKAGPVGLLLLHGLSGTPDEVQPISDYLGPKGISTLGPWLKGHGSNPKDLSPTIWQDWARDAREAYELLKERCGKVFVCGLSMGGDLALHLAAHFPVAGVISMAAPVKILDFRFNGIAFFRFLQWRTSNLSGGVLDPSASPHVTYPYIATRNLYELKKLMDHLIDDLPYITCPALVVQGSKDSMVPPSNGTLIHGALGSTLKHLVYLERSDHVVTLDYDRQILFQNIERFLATDGQSIE